MATSAEQTFIRALVAAEGTRQVAKATAFATYAFSPAGLATYIAALLAADVAYLNAVTTAANSSGLTLGNTGQSGPIAGNIASITGIN